MIRWFSSSDGPPSPTFLRARGTWALSALLVLTLTPLGLSAQDEGAAADRVDGRWAGELEIPPVPQDVFVELSEDGGGWTGTFSLPAEGVRDFPIASVEFPGDSIVLGLTPERVVVAQVDGNRMEGEFRIGRGSPQAVPIRLFRVGSEAWDAFEAEREEGRKERDALLAEHRPAPLERTADGPGADRVDAGALERLVEAASEAHSAGLAVLHEGELVGAWYSGGRSRPIESMSVTKSVLNLAVGRLLALGLLDSIDVPVYEFFPEWAEGPHAAITVRHLMDHTSGLESPMPTDPIYASDDFIRFALESPVVAEPGSEFEYNNSATNLLAGLIGVAAGQRMDRFVREALFAPMGITDVTWTLDPAGNPHGMAGLQIRPEDLALLGQLALNGGEWEGRRLIEPEWFDESLAPATGHSEEAGLLWWLQREDGETVGVRADGYLGQYLVLYPAQKVVGVRMIEGFPGYDPERDGLRDFARLLRELAP